METNYISTKQAAEMCGVSKVTIQNLCKKRVLPYILRSKAYFIDEAAVRAYADKINAVYQAEKDIDEYIAEQNEMRENVREVRESVSDALEQVGMYKERVSHAFFLLECFLQKYKNDLTTEELEFARDFLEGRAMREIGEKHGCSQERARQKFNGLLRTINDIPTREEVLEEKVNALTARVEELEVENYTLQSGSNVAHETIEIMRTPLKEFPISVRCINVASANDIYTLEDVAKMKKGDVLKCRNMGIKIQDELRALLEKHNLCFGMTAKEIAENIRRVPAKEW